MSTRKQWLISLPANYIFLPFPKKGSKEDQPTRKNSKLRNFWTTLLFLNSIQVRAGRICTSSTHHSDSNLQSLQIVGFLTIAALRKNRPRTTKVILFPSIAVPRLDYLMIETIVEVGQIIIQSHAKLMNVHLADLWKNTNTTCPLALVPTELLNSLYIYIYNLIWVGIDHAKPHGKP